MQKVLFLTNLIKKDDINIDLEKRIRNILQIEYAGGAEVSFILKDEIDSELFKIFKNIASEFNQIIINCYIINNKYCLSPQKNVNIYNVEEEFDTICQKQIDSCNDVMFLKSFKKDDNLLNLCRKSKKNIILINI